MLTGVLGSEYVWQANVAAPPAIIDWFGEIDWMTVASDEWNRQLT